MKKYLNDLLFLLGIILIFIPLFKYSLDIGLGVLGITVTVISLKLAKKGSD